MKVITDEIDALFNDMKRHKILFQFVIWPNSKSNFIRIFNERKEYELPSEFEKQYLAPFSLLTNNIDSIGSVDIINFLDSMCSEYKIDELFSHWDVEEEFNIFFKDKLNELLEKLNKEQYSYFGKILVAIKKRDNDFANVRYFDYIDVDNSIDEYLKALGYITSSNLAKINSSKKVLKKIIIDKVKKL